MSTSPRSLAHEPNHGESSADEITPIISGERFARRRYDTNVTSKSAVPEEERRKSGIGEEASAVVGRGSRIGEVRKNGREEHEGGHGNEDEVNEGKEEGQAWWRDIMDKYGSIELDNKGSVARDHLALERTFLAWLRTSLAFASIGIAITQLFRLNTTINERDGLKPVNPPNTFHLRQVGKPLGATFLGIAILVLIIGGRRYFESQYWIIRGKFPASRGSIFLISLVAVALIITSLVVVCTIDPSIFEKR